MGRTVEAGHRVAVEVAALYEEGAQARERGLPDAHGAEREVGGGHAIHPRLNRRWLQVADACRGATGEDARIVRGFPGGPSGDSPDWSISARSLRLSPKCAESPASSSSRQVVRPLATDCAEWRRSCPIGGLTTRGSMCREEWHWPSESVGDIKPPFSEVPGCLWPSSPRATARTTRIARDFAVGLGGGRAAPGPSGQGIGVRSV